MKYEQRNMRRDLLVRASGPSSAASCLTDCQQVTLQGQQQKEEAEAFPLCCL